MLIDVERLQSPERRPIVRPAKTPSGIDLAQHRDQLSLGRGRISRHIDVLDRLQCWIHDTRLGSKRQQPATPGPGDLDLSSTPSGCQIGRGDHAHHRISPPQPLMQSLTPPLADRDSIVAILVQEDLMASLDQPPMHLTGLLTAVAGVTDEYPRHHTPQSPRR